MTDTNPFFELSGEPSNLTSDEFYQHMIRSNHLCDSIYKPDKLEKQGERVTRLVAKTFERVSFSKTLIRDIIFSDCTFSDCLFIGTKIESCEFHNCNFVDTNTHKISFRDTYIDPLSFKCCLDKNRHQNIGVHLFHNLMNNSRNTEQPEFEADAHFMFLRWKRFQELYEVRKGWDTDQKWMLKKRGRIAIRFMWEWFFGSGIRIRHYAVTVMTIVGLVTVVNFFFRDALGLSVDGSIIATIYDSLYFSTITLTTLGFGDIRPVTQLGRVVVAVQSVLGFVLFATLASMLFRKIVP